MPAPTAFYLEQAAICARAASETVLPNQRETYLRSQVAWQALAERKIRIAEARAVREAEGRSS